MLNHWNSHDFYQSNLVTNLKSIFHSHQNEITSLSHSISKLYILNLDSLEDIISPCYSQQGRPAINQPEIFRSFILMLDLKCFSITNWVKELNAKPLYSYIIGVDPNNVPSIGTHYDFINRLWLDNENYGYSKLLSPKSKPTEKYGKNNKKPPKHPGVVAKLVDKILQNRSFSHRPEKVFQEIFTKISVEKSASLNILGDTNKLIIAGDGTCIETGASPYGVKVCDCKSKAIFKCDCKRKFSDPSATWGWDSYHNRWFYGYSSFIYSVYNRKLKLDLPISIRTVQATRHDSVSGVVALQELKELFPDFSFQHFLGDSAFDNIPTYKLLNHWNISPIIALNKRATGNFKYDNITVDSNGIPTCQANINMIYDGPDYTRQRIKWRCPFACNKIDTCNLWKICSPSDYGRTFHTYFKDNFRIFTPVPRGTHKWKSLMKRRSSAERVNKRILIDYNIEKTNARGKKRWSWWTMIASINIHLDAQIKHANFDEVIDPTLIILNDLAA